MLLLVDKPKGFTSHDVVNIIRKKTGERRVGHGGTLDPMATGLLIVGVGRESTRKLGEITKNTNKIYEAEVTFGATSDTDDAEGVITQNAQVLQPGIDQVRQTLEGFVGEQMQIPPSYSAVKLNGKKAYELARKGKTPRLEPRKIIIHSIELTNYEYPILNMVCEVSSGTYIRALARDLGDKLRVGAYLSALRRTRVGHYDIKEAKKLEEI